MNEKRECFSRPEMAISSARQQFFIITTIIVTVPLENNCSKHMILSILCIHQEKSNIVLLDKCTKTHYSTHAHTQFWGQGFYIHFYKPSLGELPLTFTKDAHMSKKQVKHQSRFGQVEGMFGFTGQEDTNIEGKVHFIG